MRIVVRLAAAAAAIALGIGAWTPYDAAAAEPVDLGGQPLEGSTDPAEPTAVEAGLWTTTLGPDAQYFTYERQIEDSTVHVGAIGAPQEPDGDGISLAAVIEPTDGTDPVDCGTDDVSTDSSAPYGVVGGHVVVGNEDGDTGEACRAAGAVELMLSRYSSSNTEDLPVAIKVVEEAPVSDPGTPLPESEELDPDVPQAVDGTDAPAGAASFDEAPLVDALDQVVTIDSEITEGSELLWRVPLDWGDQLVARVDLPALTEKEQEELDYPSTYVKLAIIQPSRALFALSGEDYSYGSYGDTEAARLVAATYPLRYANRLGSDVDPILPGDHWVSVTVDEPDEREPFDVPLRLTLEVTSTDVTPPTYKGAVLAQGGGAGPDGYSADTPYLVGEGEFAAVASGNPFTPDTEDGSWWGPRRYAGLGLGVVSLASCAAGAVWLARTRRVSRAAASR